jgi:hypothetical protein
MVLSNMEFCCSFSCSWLIRCSYILLICCSNKRASFYMFSHFLKMTFIIVGTWVVLVVSFLLDIAQMLLILVIFEFMNWLHVGPALANHRLFLTYQVIQINSRMNYYDQRCFWIVKYYWKKSQIILMWLINSQK